jgi:putative chitinase
LLAYGISSKARVAAFLAQIAAESQELNRLDENLNYSAERLRAVWPKRFPTDAIAQKYAHNPHALADYVYANRMGNGPEGSGDGWRYRGRGLKMLTGKENYTRCGHALDLDLVRTPDMLLTRPTAALSAAWYWHSHGLSELADDLPNDNDDSDFVTITKRINGSTIGLDQRRAYWERAKRALGV